MTIPIGIQSRFVNPIVNGTYIGGAQKHDMDGGTSVTVLQSDFDVAPSSGDLVIAFIYSGYDWKGGGNPLLNWTGNTFTSIHQAYNPYFDGSHIAIWLRTASASEPSYVVSADGSGFLDGQVVMAVVRGPTTYDVRGSGSELNSTQVKTNPALDPTVAGFAVGCTFVITTSNTTFSDPTQGWTKRLTAGTALNSPSIMCTKQLATADVMAQGISTPSPSLTHGAQIVAGVVLK